VLLRNIYPLATAQSGSEEACNVLEGAIDSMKFVCDKMAHDFLTGNGSLLLAPCAANMQPERAERLQQYYQQAGKLFTRLRAQHLELRWEQTSHLGQLYDARSMRPHPLHGVYADNEELAQNKLVEVVVSPAVSRIRRVDDDVHHHVLVRAVVCLEV
jgi:hypothetical protein